MTTEKILRNNTLIFSVLLALGILTWLSLSTFFWRDDWGYLRLYHLDPYSFFRGIWAADMKPLYQYVLFLQFYFLRDHFVVYQLINVLLLTGCSYLLYHILLGFQIKPAWAFFGGMALLLHPTNFMNVLWIFQQCELIHILLLLLTIRAFLKYRENRSVYWILVFGTSLILQNYFFPNGVFFPLLFLAMIFFSRKSGTDLSLVSVSLLAFILHLAHAFYIQGMISAASPEMPGLFTNVVQKANFFFTLISNSFGRIFIPNLGIDHRILLNLLSLSVIVGAATFLFRSSAHKLLVVLAIAGILVSTIILSLTRYNSIVVPYYYTSLHLPFFILLLVGLADHFSDRINTRVAIIAALAFFSAMVLLDVRGKRIFSTRNTMNRQKMEEALSAGTPYQPADDPAIEMPDFIRLDSMPSKETAVVLYREMLDKRQKK